MESWDQSFNSRGRYQHDSSARWHHLSDLPPRRHFISIRRYCRGKNEYRKETLGMGLWVEQLQRRGAMGEDITIRMPGIVPEWLSALRIQQCRRVRIQ